MSAELANKINRLCCQINNERNLLYNNGLLLNTAINTSKAQTITLTFPDPIYIFPENGLQQILLGSLYNIINDYTGGTVHGNLMLPFSDTSSDAAKIIQQFRLCPGRAFSVIYVNRKTSGGSTPINFGTFDSTFNHIKISRLNSGILGADAPSVDLWNSSDTQSDGFYIFINALNFTPGSERVRLIASQDGPLLTLPTCCRYNSSAIFDSLDFIQTLHPEYSLNAWCYFGRLKGNSNTYALTFLIQKNIPFQIPGIHHKLSFDIAGGFNTSALSKWQIDGCVSSVGPVMKSDPWSISDTCNDGAVPADLTTLYVQLLTGDVGTKGATYKLVLEAIISDDFHVNPVYISVEFEDVLGTVREGFGPSAFLPNWLTDEQRNAILNDFGGSVEDYLEAGIDDLACQGSYYFSQPLLQVTDFTIFDLDGAILDIKAAGDDSVIWFDYVAQTFDGPGLEILSNVGWTFFAIQFPAEKMSIMVTQIVTQTSGTYTLANLFTETGTTRWNLDDIDIQGSNIWVSPTSGKSYYMTHDITLSNPSVSLTVNTEWDDQEISVGGQTKYEGTCTVSGTVIGDAVNGFSWLEQEAI